MNPHPSSIEASHLLAPCQESLWLLHQVGEPGSAYTLPFGARLEGDLDVDALRRACQAVVDRHPPLRSVVVAAGRDGSGRLAPHHAPISWREHDLTDSAGGKSAADGAAVGEIVRRACLEPFDLERGPLIRFDLVREAFDRWTWLAVAHHIVFDGVSKTVFVEELSRGYAALVRGEELPVNDPDCDDPDLDDTSVHDSAPYAAYALEERERVGSLMQGLRAGPANGPGTLDATPQSLPLDHRRPSTPSGAGDWVAISIDSDLRAGLDAVARAHDATMFQLLLATQAVLLSRYGNGGTLTVTAAMGTRTPATPRTVGFFVNNVPVGLDIDGDPSFTDVLRQARERVRAASPYRRVPLAGWVELLNPPRLAGVNPLNQVGIAYQAESVAPVELPGVQAEWLMFMGNHGAKCDLLLQALDRHSTVEARLEYSTELFDRPTAERMAGHFRSLLEGIAAEPGRPVSSLPLLSVAERHQLVVEWNATGADYPADSCAHELFQEQARRTPTATVVVFENEALTYAELDGRAATLAAHLVALGVGPDVLVGCCLERSTDLLTGLLAIWKAGGAYVPLDPGFPPERLAVMLDDSAPAVLLTQRGLVDRLPPHSRVVCIDEPGPAPKRGAGAGAAPPAAPTLDNLAYVIYTSGSTGRPKGVMIEHRALVNFLVSMCRRPGIGPEDVMLAVTSLSFDIAALELFGPLIQGARVVLGRGDTFLDGREMAAALESSGATVMQATPVSWGLLLDAGWKGLNLPGRPPLKALCGGEALPQALASRIAATGASLWNLYGPTETTVWSALLAVDDHEATRPDREGEVVAVGRPIANTELYVLDAAFEPMPVGLWGELYIGGHGLARGYLNRPDLTAERFVPRPLGLGETGSSAGNARLYRTGDLARYRPDGIVEFGGRLDHQIKLRGFRIEPGDIEAALIRHPEVQRAAVVVHGTDAADKRLVAYLVPTPSGEGVPPPPTVDELRTFLRASLPPYMVPAVFVTLDAFPLTPNGKLDRKALPTPATDRPDLGDEFVAPTTPAQTVLAGIWCELLSIERVGVHDDFFDLGGNSLLATQMVSRARDALGVDLALRAIFDTPTVAGLATELEAAHAG